MREGELDSWTVTDADKVFDLRVTVTTDPDANPKTYDCYDGDDVTAWRRGVWSFVIVDVTPVHRETGAVFERQTASVGGVEWGLLSLRTMGRDQVWEYPGRDLGAQALETVRSELLRVLGVCGCCVDNVCECDGAKLRF